MGLVYSIRQWSKYLRVQEFAAIVDHHALLYLVTQPAKTSNVRLLNWISDLHAYRFQIYHRSGKKHLDADAVSRLIHYQDLEIHEATDTVDEDAPRDYRPAALEDIFAVHQHIETYQDQIIDLQDQLKEMKDRIETFRNMSTTDNQYWWIITDPDWRKLSNRIQTNTSLPQDQKERQEEDDKDNGPNPPIQSTEENEWIAHQQTQSMKTQYHLPDTEEGEEPNKPTTEEEDDNTTNHYPDTEEEL